MKTAIVMEGGALRTIYSAGVCDALLDAKLMPDYFVGVSAGAAYGVSYLSQQKRRNLQIVCNYANDRRYMGIGNLLNPKNRSSFGLDFSYREIPDHLIPFDYDALARYPGEADAVVTNLDTGKADYLPIDRGHDPEGILQATCAMPLLSRMVAPGMLFFPSLVKSRSRHSTLLRTIMSNRIKIASFIFSGSYLITIPAKKQQKK